MDDKTTDPYSERDLKRLLKENGIRLKKRFGQNFLVSRQTARDFIRFAGVNDTDTVIEIGAGFLALTTELAKHSKKVIAFEIDRNIAGILEAEFTLPSNATLLNEDFLSYDLRTISGGGIKIVGNLPYSVSSQILVKLLNDSRLLSEATLGFQRELARRITSGPKSRDYGTLSVLSSLLTDMEQGPEIPPGAFFPEPEITSQVIKFRFKTVSYTHLTLPTN